MHSQSLGMVQRDILSVSWMTCHPTIFPCVVISRVSCSLSTGLNTELKAGWRISEGQFPPWLCFIKTVKQIKQYFGELKCPCGSFLLPSRDLDGFVFPLMILPIVKSLLLCLYWSTYTLISTTPNLCLVHFKVNFTLKGQGFVSFLVHTDLRVNG